MTSALALGDLEARLAAGEPLTRGDLERLFDCPDLIEVGVVGEAALRRRTGTEITFCRVLETRDGRVPAELQAGEIRIVGDPASVDDAVALVRQAASAANGTPVTGFSLAWLVDRVGTDDASLTRVASALAGAGLTALAEVPLDLPLEVSRLVKVVAALREGGLAIHRLTITAAPQGRTRLDFVERAEQLAREAGDIRAFAPLPRVDPVDVPSTGYDDAKLVAAARAGCPSIERIQVDWQLYGPKMAQVALTFGAGDLDAVAAVDDPSLGPRRSAVADIDRQIRAAGGDPVERDGLYRRRG